MKTLRHLFSLLLVVFFPLLASAQAFKVYTLMDKSAQTATWSGTGQYLRRPNPEDNGFRATGYVGKVVAVENSGSATVDARIDHSPDCTNWATLLTFTTLSSSGSEDVHVNRMNTTVLPCVRAVATFTGTGNWDLDITLNAE